MVRNKLLLPVSIIVSILFIFTGITFMGCDARDKIGSEVVGEAEEISTEEEVKVITEEESTEDIPAEEEVTEKSDYLTVADVEKVSGIQGIQLVDYDPSIGAGGDINFALSDGTMFLLAQIQPESLFEQWREQENFFHEPISNLGDEAYSGPGLFEFQYIVYCLKKPYAIAVSSFFNDSGDGKPYLTQEQLVELMEIILSRM